MCHQDEMTGSPESVEKQVIFPATDEHLLNVNVAGRDCPGSACHPIDDPGEEKTEVKGKTEVDPSAEASKGTSASPIAEGGEENVITFNIKRLKGEIHLSPEQSEEIAKMLVGAVAVRIVAAIKGKEESPVVVSVEEKVTAQHPVEEAVIPPEGEVSQAELEVEKIKVGAQRYFNKGCAWLSNFFGSLSGENNPPSSKENAAA